MKIQKIYKALLFCLVFLALGIYTVGCSDSPLTNTNTKTYKARTEKDFADKNFKAEPGAVIVLNLEDKNSPSDPDWFDTDLIGVDIIPIRYTETAKHHFRIDEDSDFEMSLMNDSSKQVLFELTPQNTKTDVMIPSGNYLMIIESLEIYGSDTIDEQTVFIQPDTEAISSGNTDYDPANLNTLLSRRNCRGCNLEHANLSGANLSNVFLNDANLRDANLSRANLEWAFLNNADLVHVDLRDANLINTQLKSANLNRSNLASASLRFANLYDADLNNVNLFNAYLNNAKLNYAILRDANLSQADLSYANLSYTDLRGANFCGAIKTGIIFTFVMTNSQTRCWP